MFVVWKWNVLLRGICGEHVVVGKELSVCLFLFVDCAAVTIVGQSGQCIKLVMFVKFAGMTNDQS